MKRGIIIAALRRHGYRRARARVLIQALKRPPLSLNDCDREEEAVEDLLASDGHNCSDTCPCDLDDIMFCQQLRKAAERTYGAWLKRGCSDGDGQ